MRALGVMLFSCALALPASAQWQGPLFDGHIHYSADARASVSPAAALATLARAGIARALVSSTPDEGTLALLAADPERIAPCLRPYRSSDDRASWYRDPEILEYVERGLGTHPFVCLGELHLHGEEASHPMVARYLELAEQHGVFVHAHADAQALGALLGANAEVRVLWAHAGMSASPALVREVLASSQRVWVELSYRYDEIVSGGSLDRDWLGLFIDYPDRFVLGTDTWAPSRWSDVEPLARDARAFLAELPEEVARRIAWDNGVELVSNREP